MCSVLPYELSSCAAAVVVFSLDWIGDLPDMCIEISCCNGGLGRTRILCETRPKLELHESMTVRSYSYYQKFHVQVVIATRMGVSHVTPLHTEQNREYVDIAHAAVCFDFHS